MESYIKVDDVPQDSLENKSLKGRKAIPPDVALKVQKLLIKHMIPEELSGHFTGDIEDLDNTDDPMLNALVMRWLDKYAIDFNGFAEYCNLYAEDEFINRVLNDDLTEADFVAIKNFLETHPDGGPFFAPTESQQFIKQNTSQ